MSDPIADGMTDRLVAHLRERTRDAAAHAASVVAPKSTLTRAQVLADFLVWRASGQDDLTRRGDSNVDIYSAEYKNAQARYAYLRASAQFAALVDQIERDGSAKIIFAQRR